jgi:DNA-binding MarR family transcriptional regulator
VTGEAREAGAEESAELPLWTLVQTGHLAGRAFTEVFAAVGLSPAQFGVLACLADGDDLDQAQLARVVMVRPQSMNRLVGDMVASGLVRREGPGGRGRRAALAPTAAGLAAVARARPAAYALSTPERLGLRPDELDELSRLLTRVRHALSAGPTVDDPAGRPVEGSTGRTAADRSGKTGGR